MQRKTLGENVSISGSRLSAAVHACMSGRILFKSRRPGQRSRRPATPADSY